MELYTALHQIVKQKGESVLYDGHLINLLADYCAFEKYPATKNILREIIECKFSQLLINCKLWNIQAEKLLSEFVTKTGFQKPLSNYVFQSIAYSLGWVNKVAAPVDSSNESNIKPVKFSNLLLYKQRAYLRSIVNINIDFESYGVKPFWFFDNSSGGSDWHRKTNYYIRVVLAIEGSLNRDMHIKYCTYDIKGKMKCNQDLVIFKKSIFRGVLEVDIQIDLGTHINRISNIDFYVE